MVLFHVKQLRLILGLWLAISFFIRVEAFADADFVVFSEKIYTANPVEPWVEAVAVKDGKFTYVGEWTGALEHLGVSTVIIDASGKMVTPGFVDNHSHYLWIGALVSMMPWNLLTCESVDDVLSVVKKTAAKNPALPFVGGIGWRNEYVPGGKPDKAMLDEAVKNRPVLLMSYGGQSGWANSMATELMESRNPEAFLELEPEYLDGEATGFFSRFHAFNPFKFFTSGEMTPAERPMLTSMWKATREALSFGITTINDVQLYRDFYPYLVKFYDQGGLKRLRGRVSLYITPTDFDNPDKLDELTQELEWWRSLASAGDYEGHLRLGDSVKLYIDGVSANHTAFLFEPYADNSTNYGVPDWSQENFDTVVNLVDSMGFQACTHACGDAGANRVINSYEKAADENFFWDRRHRIEHSPMVIPEDIDRMASSGILAAMQPTHFFGDVLVETRLGTERPKTLMPWHDMLDAGVHMSFGSDWCAGPSNPAYGLLVAATRLNYKLDTDWGPEQAISFEQGLYAYTSESSYALKMEGLVGSIETGKVADFAIFSDDLTDILTYSKILIEKSDMGTGLDDLVDATFVDGRLVYCKTGWTPIRASSAKLNFNFLNSRLENDRLTVEGTLLWPSDLPVRGTVVNVQFADLPLVFSLNDNGVGITQNARLTMTPLQGFMGKAGYKSFKLTVSHQDLFIFFKDYGFIQDIDIALPGENHTLPLVFTIDGEMLATMLDFNYRVTANVRGIAIGSGHPNEPVETMEWFWDIHP